MRGFALAVLAATVAGCGSDCLKSSTVQVKLMVNPHVNQALISQLVVEMIDVGTGAIASKVIALDNVPNLDGQTFLITPTPVPATEYELYVHVVAASREGTFLATGFDDEVVSPNGCNRLSVKLDSTGLSDPTDMAVSGGGGGSIGGNPDLGGSTDMAMAPPPDMVNCIGGSPDEDHDLHADSCDACPADPETDFNANGDGDGLHDACDPDPTRPGNMLVFNDLFNSDVGRWDLTLSGGNGVTINSNASRLEMQSSQSCRNGSQTMVAGDKLDPLPNGVRAQTWYVANTGGLQFCSTETVGITLGSADNLGLDGSSGTGVLCSVNNNLTGNGASLDILRLNGNNAQIAKDTQLPGFPLKTWVRLRLTQRGNSYVCEMVTLGSDMITTSAPVTLQYNAPAPPDGAQYVSLLEENLSDTQFQSVVVETALPNP